MRYFLLSYDCVLIIPLWFRSTRSNALSLASFESTDGLGLHNPSMGIPATGNSSGIGGAESSQRRHSYQQRSIDLKEIDEIKRYEDFSTIDWVQDAARENLKDG